MSTSTQIICHAPSLCGQCKNLSDIISTKGLLGKQFLKRPDDTTPLIIQTAGNVQTADLGISSSKLTKVLDNVITKHILQGKEYTGPAYITLLKRTHFWEHDGAPVSVMLDIPDDIARQMAIDPAALDAAVMELPKLVGCAWRHKLCYSGDVNLARLQWFHDHFVTPKEVPRAGTFGVICEGHDYGDSGS